MISRDEVLMGRDSKWPLSPELEKNLERLLASLNHFRRSYGKPMTVTSGYRPAAVNVLIKNAAKFSNHQKCLACDFADLDGALGKFCLDNLELLESAGLYLEDPHFTKGWCHLQCVPPASGRRVFKP